MSEWKSDSHTFRTEIRQVTEGEKKSLTPFLFVQEKVIGRNQCILMTWFLLSLCAKEAEMVIFWDRGISTIISQGHVFFVLALSGFLCFFSFSLSVAMF